MDNKHNRKKQNKNEKQRLEKPRTVIEEINTQIPTNSNEILKLDNKFTKRKIISNWSKYEDDPVELESNNAEVNSEHSLAADFEKLLHMPAAVGSHFVFKTEKIWDTENSYVYGKFSEMFYMNLSLLQDSIISIPFNERLGYSKEMFSPIEQELLNIKAQKVLEHRISQLNFNAAQKVVKEPAQILKDKNCIEFSRKKYNKNEPLNKDKCDILNENINKIDEFDNQQINLTPENYMKEQNTESKQANLSRETIQNVDKESILNIPKIIENKNDENIQQWLDDILDS